MLEDGIDVTLAGDVPDCLTKPACLLDPFVVIRRSDLGHHAPAGKVLAVDDTLGAELHHVIALALIGHDADGIGAGGSGELHAEHAEPARGAPYQHVIARFKDVGRVPEQHAVGGCQRQHVAARLFPGQMRWLRHQLARLYAAELRE